jgi:asparagine synthase (glutamine-hydrolysing)
MGLAPDRDPRSSPVYEAVTEPYRRSGSKDPVQRSAYADLKVYLPNNSLVKLDRMSMAHGLEVRCPLLDHELVEFAFRVPAKQKYSLKEAKRLLRTLARRRLPDPIWNLPKRGFTAPVGEWIVNGSAAVFEDEVLRAGSAISTHIDIGELRRRFRAQTAGHRDESYLLWAAWVLERWLQNQ